MSINEDERRVAVCLGSMRFHPDYAGPALRFQRYAKGLRARRVDLGVFTGHWITEGDTPDGGRLGTLEPEASVEGISVQRVRLKAGEGKQTRFNFDRALSRWAAGQDVRPEVIQLLTLSTWSAPWLSRIKSLGIPLVYTHTMMPRPSIGGLRKRFDHLAFRFIDCVVASSTVMRDQLVQNGVKTRIEVIPNGVDLSRFHPVAGPAEKAALRTRLDLPAEGELVVFLGGFLIERKGLDLLADAWSSISNAYPHARLVLVGPHHDSLRPTEAQAPFLDRIKASLATSGAGDRVIMTGHVENVEDYLAAADVFVFPSRREGMPNVVAEAYASGAPTVMAPFLGMPKEFGEPGREYIAVDHSVPQIAAAVEALLGDPGRRNELARAGRDWVERTLGVERSLDRYAGLYRDLSADAGGSR
ncbi:MAG: glycosyltransferase family 4 protein [Longimicrobiales bacterium]